MTIGRCTDEGLQRRIAERRERVYAAVRNNRPELYQSAIYHAEAMHLRHNVGLKCAADIEAGAMSLVAEALGLDV